MLQHYQTILLPIAFITLMAPTLLSRVSADTWPYCWRTSDGKEMWKKRFFGGGISASPLLVQNRFYVATESGKVLVVAAAADRFELLAENPSGDSIFASPVVVDDTLYLRTAVNSDGSSPATDIRRQEYLVAIGRVSQVGSDD